MTRINGNLLIRRILVLALILYLLPSITSCSNLKKKSSQRRKITRSVKRTLPDTSEKIYVFNDQLPGVMSDKQVKFAAEHYVGCQKIPRDMARRLRKINPQFVVLHYRLGLGLGYKDQEGNWIQIIKGNEWVREWPSDDQIREEWFYRWQGERVINTDWGWYLMDVSNQSWRDWWITQVIEQLGANENDGLFADSVSVPNFFGSTSFQPHLPEIDKQFEALWEDKINNHLSFIKERFGSDYLLIVNVGSWINSRDRTEYDRADGIMIEGFAANGPDDFFSLEDWQLQMNRILSTSKKDKIIMCQSSIYDPNDVRMRLFYLANYLLVKGKHTYVNIDYGTDPEYFPECDVSIGKPSNDLPKRIEELYRESVGLYLREYTNGLVVVNASDEEHILKLDKAYYEVLPKGGGIVPQNGDVSGWTIEYKSISELPLLPHSGAVLLVTKP